MEWFNEDLNHTSGGEWSDTFTIDPYDTYEILLNAGPGDPSGNGEDFYLNAAPLYDNYSINVRLDNSDGEVLDEDFDNYQCNTLEPEPEPQPEPQPEPEPVPEPSSPAPTGNDSEGGPADDCDCNEGEGQNYFNPYTGNAERAVTDLEVFGSVGRLPLKLVRHSNTRAVPQNVAAAVFGQESSWTHNHQWLMRDAGPDPVSGEPTLRVTFPNGGDYLYTRTGAPSGGQATWLPPANTRSLLEQDGDDFDVHLPDGTLHRFVKRTDGGGHFYRIESTFDSADNEYVYSYDTLQDRLLRRVTDPSGRWLDFTYAVPPGGVNGSDPVLVEVAASDGRSVDYNYADFADPSGTFTWSTLASADYPDTTSATYGYIQVAQLARPVINQATDGRIRGKGTAIAYTFTQDGPIGFIAEESSGVSGNTVAITDYVDAQTPLAVYPSGRTVKRAFAIGSGNLLSLENGLGYTKTFAYDQGGAGFLSSYTDKRGHTTAFTRNSFGKPLTVDHPDGSTETFTYDSRNRLVSHTLEAPGFATRTTTWTRDSSGRVIQKTWPDGLQESWTYNSYGQVTSHTDRGNHTETWTYDSSGLLLSHTDALNHTTSYTHDSLDLVASVTDPLNRTESFLYNDRGQVVRRTHADGSFVEYGYDDFGNRTSFTNELGKQWTATYDEFRHRLTVTDPLNRTATWTYGGGSGCGACNPAGLPKSVTYPSGRQILYGYDLEWNLTSVTEAPGLAEEAVTAFDHDENGNVVEIVEPGGAITTRSYDNRDRLVGVTDPLSRTTSYVHDAAGNLLSETRPDSGVTSHAYDLMERRISTTDPKNQTTTFTYTANGDLASLTDARNQTYSWTYDALAQTLQKDYPDNSYEAWTWDAAGQLVTARARNGEVATSTHDNRGRETAVSWSDSTPSVTRSYDLAGRLVTSGNGQSTSSYSYDDAGQVLSETQDHSGIDPSLPSFTVSYTWDSDGNVATTTYPGGTVVSRSYTPRGQVATISEDGPPPLASYSYNLDGTRASRSLENGVTTSYGYDLANQLLTLSHHDGSADFQSRDYLYNSVGNRSAMRIDGGDWDVYAYDAVDQLVSAKYGASDSAGANPARTVSYDWDPVGNRVEVVENIAAGGQTTDSYATANAVNQYPSVNSHSLTHDANGNLTSARLEPQDEAGLYGDSTVPTASLVYDSRNRLLSVSNGSDSVTQTYDTRNRVTSRTINGQTTYFVWDGWELIEERDENGNQIRRYVHGTGVDEPLMMVDTNGPHYYVQDGLGSITALTDGNGDVIESYLYDVFGTVSAYDGSGYLLTGGPATANRFLYTGREWVAEAGLYDYRNRVYSPVLGRFLQTDPIRFGAGDVNLYRYVGNSVVDLVDPNGLDDCECSDSSSKDDSSEDPKSDITEKAADKANEGGDRAGFLKSLLDRFLNRTRRSGGGADVKGTIDACTEAAGVAALMGKRNEILNDYYDSDDPTTDDELQDKMDDAKQKADDYSRDASERAEDRIDNITPPTPW